MTAGTRPLRRDSRAGPFPARSRASALMVSTAAIGYLLQVSQFRRTNHSCDDRVASRGADPDLISTNLFLYFGAWGWWGGHAPKSKNRTEILIKQTRNGSLFADPRHRFGEKRRDGQLAHRLRDAHRFGRLDAVGDD